MNIINSKKLESSERIKRLIVYAMVFGIFTIPIYHNFHDLDMITVLNDEFGYWGNAALLAGVDWKPLMAETPYYPLGYSIVITPLFWLFDNHALRYSMAIGINAIFIFIMELISFKLSEKLLGVKRFGLNIFISVISTLTFFNVYQARSAWPEVLLSLLMWSSVWFIYQIEAHPKDLRDYIFLLIIFFCMCVVHKRTIPIVVVGSVLVLIWGKKNSISRFAIIMFIMVGICEVCIYYALNVWHATSFFGNMGEFNNEPVYKIATTYTHLFAEQGERIWHSFIGKCAVNLMGTFFVAPIVIVKIIKQSVNYFKDRKNTAISLTETYVVLSFVLMLTLVTFQCSSIARKDIPVYSRYSDFTLGPIIMYGMYFLICHKKSSLKIFGVSIVTFFALIISTMRYISTIDEFFNMPCSPMIGGVFYFVSKSESTQVELDSVVFLIKFCFLVVLVVICVMKNTKCTYFFALLILCLTNVWGLHYSNEWLDNARDSIRSNSLPLSLEILGDDEDIYFVKQKDQSDYCIQAKFLQFCIGDRTIYVIDETQISNLEKNMWVLTDFNWDNDIQADLKLIDNTKTLVLYKKE